MLAHSVQDMEDIRYRLDCSLFDLQRLNAKTKCWHQLIQDAQFADDCALLAHKGSNLQINKSRKRRRPSGWLSASARPRYCISLLQTPPVGPNISTNDTPLANVDSFKYLGSIISNDRNHIQDQQSKPSTRGGGTEVHNHHNICVSTKLIVHRAVVFTSLLYGCKTCILYRGHVKQLEHFHMRAFHSLLGVRCQDRITNPKVLDREDCTSIEPILIKA